MFNNTDDIFQLKLYNKFAQIAAESPHLEKIKRIPYVLFRFLPSSL